MQVGGWKIDYQGLTFATVRNSGHMVPYVTPERAFHLLGQFLYGEKDQGTAAGTAKQGPQRPAAAAAAAGGSALGRNGGGTKPAAS